MKKCILAMAAAASLGAMAELKIATVNMMDLVRLHPNHEANKTLIKSTDADYKAKLESQQEAARAIMEEARKVQEDAQNPLLSTAAKIEAQKKLDGIGRRFQQSQLDLRNAAQHYQSELADLETRLIKLETDDIREKINAFAKANGYDIIADSTMLAFASDKLDVTDEILKAMNVDPAKRAAKKDKADEGK